MKMGMMRITVRKTIPLYSFKEMSYNGVRVAIFMQVEDDGMQLTWDEIRANAVRFAKRWKDAANEEAQAQAFELDFFKVFGVDALEVGDFEYKVPKEIEGKGYIDYLWKQKIAIEMKSRGKSLEKAYVQLKDYAIQLPAEELPGLLMVCDFETIVLYHRGKGISKTFKTKDLAKNIRQFANIAGYETTREIEDQIEVNVKAAEKMAKLHDALKAYGYEGHDLEVYLVRLLFCLFADDTGIFPRQSFLNYLENSQADGSDLSARISQLFEILNMPDDVRAKRTLLSAEIKQFRYINGGLFEDRLPPADFNDKMRQTLLDCCHFDWNKISPTIFGAMFQGVMDKNERRELGAHYTSEENIRKLINPLFLDELWEEFERVKIDTAQLERFHRKMSQLKFLEIITPRLIQFDDCQICLTKGVQNPSRGVHFQKGVCNPLSKPQKYRKPARAMAVAPAGFRFWFYLSNVFSANPLTASTVISQVTSAA